jgi:purine nucleoside permease
MNGFASGRGPQALLSSAFAVISSLLVLSGCTHPAVAVSQLQQRKPVKVLIIALFRDEAGAWDPLNFTQNVTVPGLSQDHPTVRCNADDVCQLTTGMGHTNAAASTAAVALSSKFDLSKTYFLISGIAGIDPNKGTIGSAAWARYIVDYGIAHEIDAREMPKDWPYGYFGIHTNGPTELPELDYHNEVFQLNEALLQKALALSRNVSLVDSTQAANYRSLYPQAAAKAAPAVIQCDTAAGDTYWHGQLLGQRATDWTALLTNGKGVYCSTQQEENAIYEVLKRGAASKLLDLNRVADLRTAANFDRPHPGQTPLESLHAHSGGFAIAVKNIYIAGSPLVNAIVSNWNTWQSGVP